MVAITMDEATNIYEPPRYHLAGAVGTNSTNACKYQELRRLSKSITASTLNNSFLVSNVARSFAAATSLESISTFIDDEWEKVYSLENSKQPRLAARQVMFFIEQNLKDQIYLTNVNKFLTKAAIEKLGIHSLIGLMRISAKASKRLPAWDATYLKARERIKMLGEDPDKIFVGLPKIK